VPVTHSHCPPPVPVLVRRVAWASAMASRSARSSPKKSFGQLVMFPNKSIWSGTSEDSLSQFSQKYRATSFF